MSVERHVYVNESNVPDSYINRVHVSYVASYVLKSPAI